jgi:hypothetical protein
VLQVANDRFAYAAAQVEAARGAGGADEQAHLHGFVVGVGDLQNAYAFVPVLVRVADTVQFGAQLVERACCTPTPRKTTSSWSRVRT